MIKIIIDNAIPFVKGVLEPYCRVEYIEGRQIRAKDVVDADALMVRTRTRCDAALLESSKVRAIATATIGYDHIDTQWCRSAGIDVFTAAGTNARGVLQWLGAVLAYDSEKFGWDPPNKAIGVVGTGNVGSLSARYGKLWGFEVLCCDPPRDRAGLPSPVDEGYISFEELSRRCDIITFHTPLTYGGTDATYHMADEEFFDCLNPGTLIINSSRGEVIDGDALRKAIAGRKCRAVVDTWEHEPEIDRVLLADTMLGTPHIAGYTAQGKANASAMSVNALARFFGLPLRVWFPDEVERVAPRNISWREMKDTVKDYLDIVEEDKKLREDPSAFESLRTNYQYRQEYF